MESVLLNFFVNAFFYHYNVVCSSFFPGDHFGIYLDAKVTSFPFNVLEHPMYTGATLNFLGSALM